MTRSQDAATKALDRLVEKFMAETRSVSNARSWVRVYGDQPKGWIAPWEATEAMNDAVDDARDRYDHEFITSSRAFQVARDAYLGKGDGG